MEGEYALDHGHFREAVEWGIHPLRGVPPPADGSVATGCIWSGAVSVSPGKRWRPIPPQLPSSAAWIITASRNQFLCSELNDWFWKLAELRDRLRAEKEPAKVDTAIRLDRKFSPHAKPRDHDPVVEAIWPLQKHFPLAFPVNPAPKVPLKEGILKDAEQHLDLLGITCEQLKLTIYNWCRGTRYWASMVENAPRLDLSGQTVGTVTASQAQYAKQQASRQRGQADEIVRS
jgi:ProP effector